MLDRRKALGGFLPSRNTDAAPLKLPEDKTYDVIRKGSGKQEVATTMAIVRILKELLRDKEIGKRIVPIIPDEARTFGMDSWFPSLKIYNRNGQLYTLRRRRTHARLQGEPDRPDPARGHQRGPARRLRSPQSARRTPPTVNR